MQAEPVELVLYVSPLSVSSARARRELKALLQKYDRRRFDLKVVDVSRISDADFEQCAADRILATPTLVRRWPPSNTHLFGDMTELQMVESFLLTAGLFPAVDEEEPAFVPHYPVVIEDGAVCGLLELQHEDRQDLFDRVSALARFPVAEGGPAVVEAMLQGERFEADLRLDRAEGVIRVSRVAASASR